MNLGCPKKETFEIDWISWELGVIQICVAMIHFLSHDCICWKINLSPKPDHIALFKSHVPRKMSPLQALDEERQYSANTNFADGLQNHVERSNHWQLAPCRVFFSRYFFANLICIVVIYHCQLERFCCCCKKTKKGRINES